MAVRRRFRVLRLVSMLETPEHVEITLDTTEGHQVLKFTDPNHERILALVRGLSRLHRAKGNGSAHHRRRSRVRDEHR
jgi:hypothetical protein